MFRAPTIARLSADAPLRMPQGGRVMAGAHLEAQRQFRMSVWLVAALSVATIAIALFGPAAPVQVSSLPPATLSR